jgi:hypothetical protein
MFILAYIFAIGFLLIILSNILSTLFLSKALLDLLSGLLLNILSDVSLNFTLDS